MQKNNRAHHRVGTWLVLGVGALVGLLWYWPIGVLCVALAALVAEPFLAILLALIFDIFYGSLPYFSFLPLPITVLAALLIAVRQYVGIYLFQSERELQI